MMEPTVDGQSVAHDPRVLAFLDDAQRYCEFVESLTAGKPPNFFAKLLRYLSKLAASGVELPLGMPDCDMQDDAPSETFSAIRRAIVHAISPEVNTLAMQCLENHDDLIRVTMLDDDLGDIYSDLKPHLSRFRSRIPDEMLEAVWQWRFLYQHHWGNHLMRALTTVHEIRFMVDAE